MGGVAANGATVTAIARYPFHLDVFTVGTDNRVYSCWWDERERLARVVPDRQASCAGRTPRSRRWPRFPTRSTCSPPRPTVGSCPRGGTSGTGWGSWFQVSGGVASPGSPVTAIARYSGHLDLFVIGTDNRIYSTWWHEGSSWAGWFNVSGGDRQAGRPGRGDLSAFTEHIDVFTVGTDGVVYSTWWDGATGWAGWFQLSVS